MRHRSQRRAAAPGRPKQGPTSGHEGGPFVPLGGSIAVLGNRGVVIMDNLTVALAALGGLVLAGHRGAWRVDRAQG